MAQLDQLINAMLQHSAEALVLQPGQKPSLLINGAQRPIVKSVLTAAHVSRLTAEIAPDEHRAAVAAGGQATFDYTVGGKTVRIEVSPGPEARFRPGAFDVGARAAAHPAQRASSARKPGAIPRHL